VLFKPWYNQFSAIPRTHPPSSAYRNHNVASSSRLYPSAVLGHLSSLFRYPKHSTHRATAPLQKRTILTRHRTPVVEVATAQDTHVCLSGSFADHHGLMMFVQSLYVALRPEGKGNQQQSQLQDQSQTSTSKTLPAAVLTSPTLPPVASITASVAAGIQSQPATTVNNPPWWAHLVFFLCCASIQQP